MPRKLRTCACGALEIQCQEALQNLLKLSRPVVCGEDGGVEVGVEVGEPSGAFVIEIG